ncbi:MAG: ATP-binding protein [Bacteroidales bacterium]
MRFFKLFLLVLFFNPFQLSGGKSPVDLLLITDETNHLVDYSAYTRYATAPSGGPGDLTAGNGVRKGIIADYIKLFGHNPDVSFLKVYNENRVSVNSKAEKGFFERNIKLLLLVAGLLLLISLLIFSNISVLKHQVRKKTAELKRQLIEKEKARISSRKNESRLNSIFKIYNHAADSVDELLEYTIKQTVQLTDSKSGMLYRFDSKSKLFVLSDFYSVDKKPGTENRPANSFSANDLSICNDILKKEVAIINKNQLREVLLKHENCPFRSISIKNLLGIPVIADDNTVDGVLFIANKEEGYNESDAQQSALLINSAWRHIHKQIWHKQLISAKEKSEISESKLSLLNEMVLEILDQKKLEDVYNYITDSLHKQFPGTVILCISVNEAKNNSKLESVSGLDNQLLNRIMKVSSFNPVGKIYSLTPVHYQHFKSGKLVEFEGGLADFSTTEFPAAAAKAIQKLIGIKKIYTIGINKDDSLLAAIHFFSPDNDVDILDDTPFIETFVNQASLVLQKFMIKEELIKAKEKAEESDRLKSNFLQNMSHEIRTPLNAIVGFSQLMTEPQLTEEEYKIYAEQIQSGSDRLTGVIKDIIEISQLHSGQAEITDTEFDLIGLISEMNESMSEKAKNKNLELKVVQKIEKKKYYIETDREKLRAILVHLTDNAVKFTPEGSVKIITAIRDDRLHFSVSDTGIGISPETQKIIFEPFRQSETDTRRKFGGNGLGLSLVRAYVDLLGGKINLESQISKGTTVTVALPFRAKAAEETAKVAESSIRTASNVKNKKDIVIIAEDEYANFMYLKKLINEDNIHVLHAKDGYEVIDLCRNDSAVNLIFMDIKMPNMDGHTAAKMIKEFRPELPIIAQTAYALESDKLKFADVFDDYLTKPIEKHRVKQIINKYGSAIN